MTSFGHGLTSAAKAAFVWAGFLAAIVPAAVRADALEDGRIAIVHASQSTIRDDSENRREVLGHLRDSGVAVIGRYLSRCRQGSKNNNFWTKRLVNGGTTKREEADAILNAELAIVSIYQYKSGDSSGRRKYTSGLRERIPSDCEDTVAARKIAARPNPADRISMSAIDEGELDAWAAVAQAHAVGQPARTAIYFGVDYDFNINDAAEKRGVLEYFRVVRDVLKKPEHDFLVGAYGNGDVLGLLLGEGLVDLTWISPSASYGGTSKFHTSGNWHIAQSISDNRIAFTNAGLCFQFEYDGDIQNKSEANGHQYVGAWTRAGPYVIPRSRTVAIYDQRRFVCNFGGVEPEPALKSCSGPPQPKPCDKNGCFARIVRIRPADDQPNAASAAIDFHDYGKFGGGSARTSLTRSLATKPIWNDRERASMPCTCFGSDEGRPCR